MPAKGLAEVAIAQMVANSLGLTFGHGLKIYETASESGFVDAKIKMAGSLSGSQATMIYATIVKINPREWDSIGYILVVSDGRAYIASCLNCKEGTFISPLEECKIGDVTQVREMLAA